MSEPGYRGYEASPWLTTAATMAMSVLLSRGLGGGGQQTTHQRSPMPDDSFGDLFGGGGVGGGGLFGGGGGTFRRPRISLGRGGRGMGSR